MAQWHKIPIQRENGETIDAQAPLIVSASRSTDIPAFFADWYFHRLEVGYSTEYWQLIPYDVARSQVSGLLSSVRFLFSGRECWKTMKV